jgi:hypothetical protein
VLAYVFWHTASPAGDAAAYEEALARFQRALLDAVPSGFLGCSSHAVVDAPWLRGPGYEDWYLVEDWTALGELNAAAVAAARKGEHDAAARLAGEGWAGVWRLVRGAAEPPAGVHWQAAAPEDDAAPYWQRQMTLGPAPEFCILGEATGGRERIA